MNQSQEIGYVVSSRDFLVYLDGFPTIKINDMVESDSGLRGWVNALAEDQIEVLMLDEGSISTRQQFIKLPNRLGVGVGDFLLGRAINSLGVPIDGKGMLSKTKTNPILELEQTAPGIEAREFITEQFLTGMTLVDTLIPIGKGQRELILGDNHSGKTGFLIDVIVSQKNTGVICIVALIGKPAVAVRNFIDILKANDALGYTIIIATSSSEMAPLIFLTPKTAITVAEYFSSKGRDVLLILDDLAIHAKIYREMALLGNKSPGRESYPGDTFYQQAHLLERAGNFNAKNGGGSITALPVAEINLNDFTTLIPTNLMAMTDGHLLFKSALFNQGQRPAIDLAFSVSRVGKQTQDRVASLIASRVRQLLSTAQELETISRFSSELPPETQLTLRRKDLILEMLKQDPLTAIPKQIQVILLTLPFTAFLQDKDQSFVERYKKVITEAFLTNRALSSITKQIGKLQTDTQLFQALEGAGPTLAKLCP